MEDTKVSVIHEITACLQATIHEASGMSDEDKFTKKTLKLLM